MKYSCSEKMKPIQVVEDSALSTGIFGVLKKFSLGDKCLPEAISLKDLVTKLFSWGILLFCIASFSPSQKAVTELANSSPDKSGNLMFVKCTKLSVIGVIKSNGMKQLLHALILSVSGARCCCRTASD